MRASGCSFEHMRSLAVGIPALALAISFVQVEDGLDELRAHWDGFVEVSDEYGIKFKSRREICNDFATVLSEFVEYTESLNYSWEKR